MAAFYGGRRVSKMERPESILFSGAHGQPDAE
jgi:hypothetical protein